MKNTFRNIIELEISNQTISNGYANFFGKKESADFVVYSFSDTIHEIQFYKRKVITTRESGFFKYNIPSVV